MQYPPSFESSVPTYHVFSDGSATVKGTRTGAYTAIIHTPERGTVKVCGSAAPTTISRMEMLGPIEALRWIIAHADDAGIFHFKIELRSDSEFFIGCCTGRNERRANRDLWDQYEYLTAKLPLGALSVAHVPRNTIPEQASCDEFAGKVRRSLEGLLGF